MHDEKVLRVIIRNGKKIWEPLDEYAPRPPVDPIFFPDDTQKIIINCIDNFVAWYLFHKQFGRFNEKKPQGKPIFSEDQVRKLVKQREKTQTEQMNWFIDWDIHYANMKKFIKLPFPKTKIQGNIKLVPFAIKYGFQFEIADVDDFVIEGQPYVLGVDSSLYLTADMWERKSQIDGIILGDGVYVHPGLRHRHISSPVSYFLLDANTKPIRFGKKLKQKPFWINFMSARKYHRDKIAMLSLTHKDIFDHPNYFVYDGHPNDQAEQPKLFCDWGGKVILVNIFAGINRCDWVGKYKNLTSPVVNVPIRQLVGFKLEDKMRDPKSMAKVDSIAKAVQDKKSLPPILARKYENGYQVIDGHHRFYGHKKAGASLIQAQIVPPEDTEEGITPQWNQLEKYMHRERTVDGKRTMDISPAQRRQIWNDNPEDFISCHMMLAHYIEQDNKVQSIQNISTEYTNAYVELVTETTTDFFFITEKTVKPLAFGMCFVMIGCYRFLNHLRRLGFKTFHPYIDESYDQIKDRDSRIETAFKAFKKFIMEDKDFDALQKICDHNRKHLKYLQDTYTFSDRQWKKLSRVIDF